MKIDADKALQYIEMIDTLDMILAPNLHAKVVEHVRGIIFALCNNERFIIEPEAIDEMALVETLVYKTLSESNLFSSQIGFSKREFFSLYGLIEEDVRLTSEWLDTLTLSDQSFNLPGDLGNYPIFFDASIDAEFKNEYLEGVTPFTNQKSSSGTLYEAMLEDQVEDLIIEGLQTFDITSILDKYSNDLHGMGFAMKEIQSKLSEMESSVSGELSKIGRVPGFKPLLNPKIVQYASALYQVMYLYNASGDSEKVVDIGERLLQMGPEDPYEIKGSLVAHGLVTERDDLVDELLPRLMPGSIEHFYNRALVSAVRKETHSVLLLEEAIEAYPLVAELMLFPERTEAIIDKISFGTTEKDRIMEAVFHYHTSSLTAWEQFPTIMSQLGHLYRRRKVANTPKETKGYAKIVQLDSKRK